jgi:predicted RNA-binding protein
VFLEVKPQETVTTSPDGNIRILRFDFKATILMASGEQKKVLIELQKLKQSLDIMRFRRYLGDNYAKEDDVILDDGTQVKMPLPIVTIYILGFLLNHLHRAAVKINREYTDIFTGQVIEGIKDDFVELLTHDSYVIQTRLLPPESKTKLERILQVFNPKFRTKDTHKLDFTGDANEPIVQKILNRLQWAIADEEMRHLMNVEDEFERILAKAGFEKDKIIAEQAQAISEQAKALSEKNQALEAERQKVELLMKQLASLQKKGKK